MGIKVKSLDQYIMALKVSGTLTTGLHKDVNKAPFTGFLANVHASLGTPGTGSTGTILDVNKNGTSIYSSGNITLAATTGAASYGPLAADPVQVEAGDIFSVDVDQIASNPINAVVLLTLSKRPPAATDKQTDHDNIL